MCYNILIKKGGLSLFYKFITKVFNIIIKMRYKVEIIGEENIPLEGGCIIAPNHKSNWDALIIAGLINKRKLSALAKKELFRNPFIKTMLSKLSVIPVDREKPELSTIKSVLKILKNKETIVIFPEGTRHKDLDSFAEAKVGIGMFALKSKCPIIPVSIVTDYKIFSKLTLVIGQPMYFDELYGKKNDTEDYEKVSQDVMNKIEDNYLSKK